MNWKKNKRGCIEEVSMVPLVMAVVAGLMTLLMFSILGKISPMHIATWVKIATPILTVIVSYLIFNVKFGE